MRLPSRGFFQPMDTLREKQLLEELWQSGQRAMEVCGATMIGRRRFSA